MVSTFNPKNWYWLVADEENRIFSSAEGTFVEGDNQAYRDWRGRGDDPTSIASRLELYDVLARLAPGRVPSWTFSVPQILSAFVHVDPGQTLAAFSPDEIAGTAAVADGDQRLEVLASSLNITLPPIG